MNSSDRIELALNQTERSVLEDVAALQGTTVAEFARKAALEKARRLIEHENRINLSNRDFADVTAAVEHAFEPTEVLRRAIESARTSVRREKTLTERNWRHK